MFVSIHFRYANIRELVHEMSSKLRQFSSWKIKDKGLLTLPHKIYIMKYHGLMSFFNPKREAFVPKL